MGAATVVVIIVIVIVIIIVVVVVVVVDAVAVERMRIDSPVEYYAYQRLPYLIY